VIGTTTDTYAYSPTANQISTITTGSNVRTFGYLASGQVSSDVRDPSNSYSFSANNNGRNASASLNGTTAGTYLYNAFEQRVQKTAGSTTTQFVFDRFGHLLEEANSSGVAQKEYIWLDDMPVAVVDDTGASPVLYYIHTDQLGTPQKITDGSMNVVWDGVFDPFGNPVSGFGGPLTNLRFPGQYFDSETALNQNWYRDYDPTTGRYAQSDPLGIRVGTNTYAYVGDNPIVLLDPSGQQWWGPALRLGVGLVPVAVAFLNDLYNNAHPQEPPKQPSPLLHPPSPNYCPVPGAKMPSYPRIQAFPTGGMSRVPPSREESDYPDWPEYPLLPPKERYGTTEPVVE
jgi:RHS repeat-associated protein